MTETISNPWIKIKVEHGSAGLLISSVQDLVHEKEWLYSEKSITTLRSLGLSFDEQYGGGMEFIFPGDQEEIFKNRLYRDHGQLWRIPFQIYREKDSFMAVGWEEGLKVSATISLRLFQDNMLLQTVLENKSDREIPYLFRLHPAFVFGGNTLLSLHGEKALFEEKAAYCSFVPGEEYPLINAENPGMLKENDIFFHTKVIKGEFSVMEGERSFRMEYEKDKLPWLTYCSFMRGGKRIGILEPANAPGVSLTSIAKKGLVPLLKPKEKMTCDFRITLK